MELLLQNALLEDIDAIGLQMNQRCTDPFSGEIKNIGSAKVIKEKKT